MTDRDLAPIDRVEANYWQAKYFEAQRELTKANKGLRRLRAKLDYWRDDSYDYHAIMHRWGRWDRAHPGNQHHSIHEWLDYLIEQEAKD